MDGRIEKGEHDNHAKDIEKQVRKCGAFGLYVRGQRCKKGGNGSTDILTQRERHGLCETETGYIHAEEHQRDSHRGGGRLHQHGHHSTHEHEKRDCPETIARQMTEPSCHVRTYFQRFGSLRKQVQAHEQKSETEEKLSPVLRFSFSGKEQRQCDSQQRQRECGDAHFETDQRDDPRRDCSADIGSHDYPDSLTERHQSGIDETDHHDGGCTTGLDECGHTDTCQHAHKTVACHGTEDVTHVITCQFFKPLGHDFHAIKKEAE